MVGGRDYNIVVFGVWLSMLKAVLRQKLWSLEELTQSSVGRCPWRVEKLVRAGSFSRTFFLEAQKQFMPFKGKGSTQRKRSPWLNCELLIVFKTKREL